MSIHIQYYKSPVGELIIGSYKDKLCLCDWRYRKMRTAVDDRIQTKLNTSYIESTTPIIKQTISELKEYFTGKRQTFSIPLHLIGTEFQQQVWKALLEIPFGKTESYLGLSRLINNEKAIRAVGTANGANAISIIVPCHRIIGSDGNLTGYAGGISAKKKLLILENALDESQLTLF